MNLMKLLKKASAKGEKLKFFRKSFSKIEVFLKKALLKIKYK